MKKKSERLSVLVKIEEANERAEARKFSEYRKAVQDKKNKLTDLQGYLDEYRDKFLELSLHGIEADKIRSCYAFISQLNAAIAQQQKAVQDAEHAAEDYRRVWSQAKQRMDILEKTISNIRKEELRHENKKEQLLADDLARYKQHDH